MISFFRRLIGSKLGAFIGIAFLALIFFAFAAGDISQHGGLSSLNFFNGNGTKIGGKTLSDSEVESRIQRVFETSRRQTPGLTIGQFLAQGAVPQLYDELVSGIALNEFAKDQGIFISKRMVDARIASIPAFHDASGQFSQSLFRQLLAQQNVSEDALRDDIYKEMTAKLVAVPAGLGVRMTDSLVLPYASLLLEARAGRIAAIPSAAFLSKEKPTDAQLAAFYRSNADRYTIPEQRKFRYAIVDASRFTAAATPTDSEVKAYYDKNRAQYAARETRSIEQLILPTEAAAKQAAGAGSLAAAAKAAGLAVTDLANVTKADFAKSSSAAAANAAFSAPAGKVVGPVKLELGWALIQTKAVQAIPEKSLESARADIVTSLQKQKQANLLSDFVAKVEDEIANGGTFDEVIKDNGLAVETTPAMVANGQSPETPDYQPSNDIRPLLKPGFDMELDDDAQFAPIVPDQRYALLDVTDVIAAAPPALAKVRPLVEQQYLLHEGTAKAKTLAEKLRGEIAKGKDLDVALKEAGVALLPSQKVAGRRAELLRGDRQPPAEIALLFAMAKGSVKTMAIPGDRGMFIIKLDDIQQGDAAKVDGLVDRVRQDIGRVVSIEYSQQFERAVERDLGVDRKPAMVDRVTQGLRRLNGAAAQ